MDNEGLIRVSAIGVAGAEVVGATVTQAVASAEIKSALGEQGLEGLGSLLAKAVEAGVIQRGPAEAIGQIITGAGQQAADICETLKQSLEASPLGGVVQVACENTFNAALKGLETEMLNGGERLLGGLRMAGVMGLASIFLSRRLTEEWGRVFDNEFYAFLAAQGTLVLGSAAVNTFILAPIGKLSWSAGDLGRDIGVGFGMAIVTILGEVATQRLANLKDMGPSVGVFGMALLKARGAIHGATTLFHLLS